MQMIYICLVVVPKTHFTICDWLFKQHYTFTPTSILLISD